MMFWPPWPSACRRHTGSTRPRLIGFAHTSAIANRRSSLMGSFLLSALSAVASLRAPYLGRCCSCSTPPTWVSLLSVSLGLSSHFYADDSQLYTWGLHRQLHSSGIEWSLVSSESPNGCAPTHCGLTPRRWTSCGVRPIDGVCSLTPLS